MKTIISVILVCAVATRIAGAQSSTEVGDAGDLPTTAQATALGPLTTIFGALTAGPGDADLYLITIVNPAIFSASTVASSVADTQLFLFTINGFGIAGNDNFGSSMWSALPPAHPLLSGLPPGPYILGVSGFNNEPLSAGGAIFPDLTTGVLGPTGPGGGLPLSGWSGGGVGGSYIITLTGASGYPAPPSLGLLVMAALAGRRRRRT